MATSISPIEKQYINVKYLTDASKKLYDLVKNSEFVQDVIDEVYNILHNKKEKLSTIEQLKDGESGRYKNFYVYRLYDYYTAFLARESKKLDEEDTKKLNQFKKEIEAHFKDATKPISQEAQKYVTQIPAITTTDLNLYFESLVRKNIDSLKSMGLNITKFKALSMSDKIAIVEKIAKKDFSKMTNYLEETSYVQIRLDRKINVREFARENIDNAHLQDLKLLDELIAILQEDVVKNSHLVLKEAKELHKKMALKLESVKSEIEYNKNVNFSILKRKSVIKYDLDKEYSERNGIYVSKINIEKFYSDNAKENIQKVVMFVDDNPKKLEWNIEEHIKMTQKSIEKNKNLTKKREEGIDL